MAQGARTIIPITSTDAVVTDTQTNDGFGVHIFSVTTSGFYGELDLKGRANSGSTWFPVRYWVFSPGDLGLSGPFTGPITPPVSGTKLFYVVDPWRIFQITRLRTAGALALDYFPRDSDPGILGMNVVSSGGNGGAAGAGAGAGSSSIPTSAPGSSPANPLYVHQQDTSQTITQIWDEDGPLDEQGLAVRLTNPGDIDFPGLDCDWVLRPSPELAAGTNWTDFSLIVPPPRRQRRYLTHFMVYVRAGNVAADIVITCQSILTGDVLWRDVIGNGSPSGSKIGFVNTRGLPGVRGSGLAITSTGSTGALVLGVNAAGYTA